MFTSLFLGILGAVGALSLGISIVSLMLHWKRPEQHPDTARVEQDLAAVRTAHMELLDKVEHWMKRDRVRKAREGRQTKPEAVSDDEPDNITPLDRKAQLRKRAQHIAGVKS